MRVEATWKGQVLAESDQTVRIEGNHYFPLRSLNKQYFTESTRHTVCPWKGVASYYDVVVDGEANPGAAWFYPDPSRMAASIKDHVAFWNGVRVDAVED